MLVFVAFLLLYDFHDLLEVLQCIGKSPLQDLHQSEIRKSSQENDAIVIVFAEGGD